MARKSRFPAWGFLALGFGNLGAGLLYFILIMQGQCSTINNVKSVAYAFVGLVLIFIWSKARKNA